MPWRQRQRILLARALHKRPTILVLDEATSQLDVGNEQLVGKAVAELRLTQVLVAHRREAIAMADRVVALGQGLWFGTWDRRSLGGESEVSKVAEDLAVTPLKYQPWAPRARGCGCGCLARRHAAT